MIVMVMLGAARLPAWWGPLFLIAGVSALVWVAVTSRRSS